MNGTQRENGWKKRNLLSVTKLLSKPRIISRLKEPMMTGGVALSLARKGAGLCAPRLGRLKRVRQRLRSRRRRAYRTNQQYRYAFQL